MLNNAFSLKDLGEPHYFLGIEVTKTATGLHLSHGKYIPALLIRAKMIDAKGIAIPMVTTLSLSLTLEIHSQIVLSIEV